MGGAKCVLHVCVLCMSACCVCPHTAQGTQFNLTDRSSVASLLMVCFQDDLDYATE